MSYEPAVLWPDGTEARPLARGRGRAGRRGPRRGSWRSRTRGDARRSCAAAQERYLIFCYALSRPARATAMA